jgi:hypothetical protein
VNGVASAWGSFSLSFEGAATGPLAFSAQAADVQSALRALGTVGEVSVTRAALGRDAFGRAVRYAWAVTFDTPSGASPSNWGALPLLAGDVSNIVYPYVAATLPTFAARSAAAGSVGNGVADDTFYGGVPPSSTPRVLLDIRIYPEMLQDFGVLGQTVLFFVPITWAPLEQVLPSAVEPSRMK